MTINFPPAFAKNWKTTLTGVAGFFIAAMQTYNAPTFSAAAHDPRVQMAVIVGILGLIAKDHNVTGGDTGQPSTPQALKDANAAPAKAPNAPEKPEEAKPTT